MRLKLVLVYSCFIFYKAQAKTSHLSKSIRHFFHLPLLLTLSVAVFFFFRGLVSVLLLSGTTIVVPI